LDLEQKLVVRVVGDRMVQEGDLAARAPQFFEQQRLVAYLRARRSGLSTATVSTAPSRTASLRPSRPGRSSLEPL
jgi:hypothetical protein